MKFRNVHGLVLVAATTIGLLSFSSSSFGGEVQMLVCTPEKSSYTPIPKRGELRYEEINCSNGVGEGDFQSCEIRHYDISKLQEDGEYYRASDTDEYNTTTEISINRTTGTYSARSMAKNTDYQGVNYSDTTIAVGRCVKKISETMF